MSRLKRLIQTARISLYTHCADTCRSFKQKTEFLIGDDLLDLPHILTGKALRQNGSIIIERSFAKKSGISLCGKLCWVGQFRNELPVIENAAIFLFSSNAD
jgi:hypothetical protein